METRKTKKMVLQLTIVVATVLLGFAALRSVQAVAGLSTAAPSVAAALTGAIYTSTADGTTVNAKSPLQNKVANFSYAPGQWCNSTRRGNFLGKDLPGRVLYH